MFENDDFGYATVDVRRPQRDEQGEIVRDKKGHPVADKELNDTENIPLTESVQDHMARKVLSYAPDAWIEPHKQKKGQLLEQSRQRFCAANTRRPGLATLSNSG